MQTDQRKILFIVNPNAGKGRSAHIIEVIKKEMPAPVFYRMETWKNKEHFEVIAKLLLSGEYTDAIAVGGDGTVNQVAKTILNTNIALGIVPTGSGNGLARTLGLSMNTQLVIRQIAAGRVLTIDSGMVNGIPFFCTSGVGFDARIGHLFAASVNRGLRSYIKITLLELFRYKAKNYTLIIDGKTIQKKAFLVTVANSGQYGNDFYIAPLASMQDGLFHIVILKPFNLFTVVPLFFKILNKKAHLSRYVETYLSSRVVIRREFEGEMHFDGEPTMQGTELVFEIKRNSLKVIVGEKFKAA